WKRQSASVRGAGARLSGHRPGGARRASLRLRATEGVGGGWRCWSVRDEVRRQRVVALESAYVESRAGYLRFVRATAVGDGGVEAGDQAVLEGGVTRERARAACCRLRVTRDE